MVSGCCKEVYRFPRTTYLYSTCISSFLQQHFSYFFDQFLNVFILVIIIYRMICFYKKNSFKSL